MYMPSHRYPGNADVPVGMLAAPCAIVRNPADEDVGVPRIAMRWYIHVLNIFFKLLTSNML